MYSVTFSTVDFTPITEGFTAVKDAIAGLRGEGNGALARRQRRTIALQLAIGDRRVGRNRSHVDQGSLKRSETS